MKGREIVGSVVLLACCAGVSRGGDAEPANAADVLPTDRERRLEQRVEDLERQLAEVNRRLGDPGVNRNGSELESRVAELETLTRKDKDGLFGSWRNGLRLDSANGAFKLRIGGRIQNDWSFFPKNGDIEEFLNDQLVADGVPPEEVRRRRQVEAGEEFRRARLQIGGTIYGNIEFMGEYDFANGAVKFREVWIGLRPCPTAGLIQVGSMKEPFGLEEQTSDLFTTFLERSAGNEAFSPSYNTGAMVSDTAFEDRVAWAAGVFRDANDAGDDVGNTNSHEYNFTGRLTGRPWIGDTPDQWLHLGVAASQRRPPNETVQYRSRPEMHLAPVLVDTGPIAADEVLLSEFEAAFSTGPFWASFECYRASVETEVGRNIYPRAWSLQAGWFLTGESRPYNAKRGVFDRVVPAHDFDGAGGSGAIEVASRYDRIDLTSGDVDGGGMSIFTVGANWYLNPNTRVQLGVVYTHLDDVGRLLGVEMRFQIDF